MPHVLHVRPRPEDSSPAALDSLRRYFSAWPEVDVVQIDAEWVLRFNAILELLRRLLLIAAALLGVGVLAVVGNTIRLEIAARRAEIEVTKLVGGSNAFVRRPFLYTGMLYGLGGALLAWGLIALAIAVLGEPVATLAGCTAAVLRCADRRSRTSPHCSAAARCWDGLGPGSPRPGTCAASSRAPERRAGDRCPPRWWRRSGWRA